jgi:hypothetical protein
MVKNKSGAMELSIGTIVILVLAMTMLILGLILVRSIFSSATSAISDIDKGVRDAIAKSFSDSDKKISVYPSARTIEIKQRTQGRGFAFALRNVDLEDKTFEYIVAVDSAFNIKEKCKITSDEAKSWLIAETGTISLGRGSVMEDPEIVLFNIPDDAPTCTIPYKVSVKYAGGSMYAEVKVYLSVISR